MSKLPFMQFFPTDWIRDTRMLSPMARGCWIDAICTMWDSPERGVCHADVTGMSRMWGCTEDETFAVLEEFKRYNTCEVEIVGTGCHAAVTLMSRRIVRDENEREQARIRKNKQRAREAESGVTEKSRAHHGDVTPYISEVIYQKSEKKICTPKVKNVNISFPAFWDAYGKKIDPGKCEKKWNSLTDEERTAIMAHIPAYVKSTPVIKYRRNPMTYLNSRHWESPVIPDGLPEKTYVKQSTDPLKDS